MENQEGKKAFSSGAKVSRKRGPIYVNQKEGTLTLEDGRLRFETRKDEVRFDVPLEQVTNVKWPWAGLGRACGLTIDGTRYACAFGDFLPVASVAAQAWNVKLHREGRSVASIWKRSTWEVGQPPRNRSSSCGVRPRRGICG